jgi:hypothetical protein
LLKFGKQAEHLPLNSASFDHIAGGQNVYGLK